MQGSETQVEKNQKKTAKNPAKTHPSFLVLLISKDFIMFKAFNSTSSDFAK